MDDISKSGEKTHPCSICNKMVAYGCRKRKKLIYGKKGEIVVAHGCLKRKKLICGKKG